MRRKTKADDILSEARREKRTRLIVRAAVVAVMTLAAAASYGWNRLSTHIVALERQVEEGKARIYAMEQALEHQRNIMIKAQRLPIEGLVIRNVGGELSIAGRIRNTLPFEVNDIELTVYLLDDDETTVLHEESFTVSSTDGLPLSRGLRRPFRLKLDSMPGGARDVVVLVTGVEAEGLSAMSRNPRNNRFLCWIVLGPVWGPAGGLEFTNMEF